MDEGARGQLLAMALLMVAPFFVLFVIGGGLLRAGRRERRARLERWLEEGGTDADEAGKGGKGPGGGEA